MLHPRMLWCCAGILMLAFGMPVQAAKPKEKAPLPEENSRAAELVKIGLEAELAGDSESRNLHLQAALDIEPEYAPANWQLAKVRLEEEWLPVANAAAEISKSPGYSWYRSKRMELDGSMKKELALARWCEQEGMHDRAQFHYARLLQNPAVDERTVKEAIKKLDLMVYDGRLRPRDEALGLAREKALDEAAWSKWEKKFAEWHKAFEGSKEAKQKYAHDQLLTVDDFHVTPLIESHLTTASQSWSQELLLLLAKFPQPEATAALTRYAILSPHELVRDQAIAELKKRKLHDFVPMLMAGLSPTTRSQFLVTVDRSAKVNYQHFIEQESATERKVVGQEVQTAIVPVAVNQITQGANRNPIGTTAAPVRNVDISAVAQQEAAKSIAQAQQVEQQVALQNQLASVHNERFFIALEQTTGQAMAREPVKWWQWWKDYNDAHFSKQTSVQVDRSYQVVNPIAIYNQFNLADGSQISTQPRAAHGYCFVAGTKVHSEAGLQRIEEIQPGDRVLSQNPDTGELAMKIVLYASKTPLSKLQLVKIGNEEFVSTPGHPYWVNGSGWKMAKELHAGQHVHTLRGAEEVQASGELAKQDSVYNLVVADFNTYFIGEAGALVHDLPYRQPTLAKVPGLVDAGR
jgi:hypothetical protein